MDEKQRILKTLSDLYDGCTWTDLSILQVVGNLTSEQAFAKPVARMHSVWEYLNHIIFWRTKISRFISGQAAPQEEDSIDFAPVTDTSEMAWRQALQEMKHSHYNFMNLVAEIDDEGFDLLVESFPATNYELIQGIIQHDAYHLGQAMIVKKIVAPDSQITSESSVKCG